MRRKASILLLLLSMLFVNCTGGSVECEICGEFEMVNFSKNQLTETLDEAVSIRRNLLLNEFSGEDYFTIWSWDEETPSSAWTETVEKEIEVIGSHLSIQNKGTWSWEVVIEETFQSSPYFGDINYRIDKSYHESGTWTYLSQGGNHIELDVEQSKVNNKVVVLDETDPSIVLDRWPVYYEEWYSGEDSKRKFQVSRSQCVNDYLTLESVGMMEDKSLDDIQGSSYSLAEGDIMLTLDDKEALGRLAERMK